MPFGVPFTTLMGTEDLHADSTGGKSLEAVDATVDEVNVGQSTYELISKTVVPQAANVTPIPAEEAKMSIDSTMSNEKEPIIEQPEAIEHIVVVTRCKPQNCRQKNKFFRFNLKLK